MTKFKRPDLLILIFTMLICCPAVQHASTEEIPEYIAKAPGHLEYPNDDGLFLQRSLDLIMTEDGAVVRHYRTAIKVLGPRIGRLGLLDPRIDWNDAHSTMLVDQARAYMVDGTAVDALENSLVPNTAGPLAWAAPFADLRQMTVAHVGVEEGGTVVLHYTVKTRGPREIPSWGVYELGSQIPVLDAGATFKLPADTPFHYQGISCDLKPRITTTDGLTSYEFRLKDLGPVNVSEPAHGQSGPCRLLFSMATDWTDAVAYLQGVVDGALLTDPRIREKIDEISDGSLQPKEISARIHEFVVDGIRTIRWPLEKFDFQARTAVEVLDSSVGHPLEKAVLLAAMLRSGGFEACVALASSSPGPLPDIPTPVLLDKAWVRVGDGPRYTWLDPTATLDHANLHDLQNHVVLVLDGSGDKPATRTVYGENRHIAILKADIEFENGGHQIDVSGTADIDLAGRYNPLVSYDRSRDRPGSVARKFSGLFGGGEAVEINLGGLSAEEVSLRAVFSEGVTEAAADGMIHMHLPDLPGAISGAALQMHRVSRTLPIVLPVPATEIIEITYNLPDGYVLEYAPNDIAVSNATGSYSSKIEMEDGSFTLKSEFRLSLPIVTPDLYPALRAVFLARDAEANRTILLKKVE